MRQFPYDTYQDLGNNLRNSVRRYASNVSYLHPRAHGNATNVPTDCEAELTFHL
jgi:hypothetical protein